MGRKTSIYLSDELDAAVRESGLPLPELVRRGLKGSAPADHEAVRRAAVMLARVADLLAAGYQLVPPG
jgi:hypothetical protein